MPKLRRQPSTIQILKATAETHGYQVSTRSQDRAHTAEEKKFLPDLVAVPFRGKGKRVFEVEATVTNNTIYKSLFSLLTALKRDATNAYLVVPKKHIPFAEKCLKNVKDVMKHFAPNGRGAPKKIQLQIVSFEEAAFHYKKADKYVSNGRIGQPPKCPFFPRIR